MKLQILVTNYSINKFRILVLSKTPLFQMHIKAFFCMLLKVVVVMSDDVQILCLDLTNHFIFLLTCYYLAFEFKLGKQQIAER